MSLDQVGIVVCSGAAAWLVGRRESWRRWGFIVGLAGQPFWAWAAWKGHQGGVLLMVAWYAFAYAQGVWNYWIRPEAGEE